MTNNTTITGLDNLDKAFAKFMEGSRKNALLVAQRVILEGFRRVAMRMPVDTGLARGSTHVTVGVSPDSDNAQGTPDKGGQATIARGVANTMRLTLGQAAWIYNNVNYIVYIENGSDKVAPRKPFALAVADMTRMLQR